MGASHSAPPAGTAAASVLVEITDFARRGRELRGPIPKAAGAIAIRSAVNSPAAGMLPVPWEVRSPR